MYQSPARVRAFFVAAATASLLAACSGGGMNPTPSTLSAQSATGNGRTAKFTGSTPTPSPTPTVAPTATPAGNFSYKIVTGLKMDSSGAFSEVSTHCDDDAPTFESDTALSLPVAAQTALAVCTNDDDNWGGGDRHGDAVGMFRTVNPPPTATPAPTPTPGVATDLVIIRKTVGGDDEGDSRHGDARSAMDHGDRHHGSKIVVLTGVANLYNNVWTFPALGITNDLAAGQHYKFYVAHQVQGDNDGDHHGHDGGGDDDHHDH